MLSRAVPRAGPGHKLSGPPLLELVLTRASGPLCQCPARVWRIYLYTPGHVSLPRMRGVAPLSACRFRSSRLLVLKSDSDSDTYIDQGTIEWISSACMHTMAPVLEATLSYTAIVIGH